MVLAIYWVVSCGIRWFQLVLDRFRPFLVLVSTERLNVGIDLMCSFFVKLFFVLGSVQNFNHFDLNI